ncbi:C-factor [Gammaproteobacteria bacterium]|nr:C-factor [Gammaproteobacteria bacterium]
MLSRILVLLAGALFAAPTVLAEDAAPAPAHVPTVLVTGANRGIGLELVRQYAARGARVIATARDPAHADELKALAASNPRVSVEQLDVTDLAQIRALAAKLAQTPIDILINNAGVNGGMQNQMFGKMDYAVFEDVLRVNTIAPLAISEAFMPSILAGHDKRIVAISSSEGSVGLVSGPRLYFMRASKAALNMEMRTLAFQLKPKGVSVAILNPGMVDTDFMKGLPKNMLRPVGDAARDLIRNIDGLTIDNTGSFINYDGAVLPW